MSREKGGTAVVVEVEGDVGGTMRGEVVIEIGGVDGWDSDVLCIVEEIDGFEGTGCPPLAQVVGLHSGKEPLRNGGLEIEHGGCDIVGHDKRADKGVNLLAGVAFAEHPFVDVAEEGFNEDAVARDSETEEMVIGKKNADDGGWHTCNGVKQELAVGGGNVVGASTGVCVVEMDVRVTFCNEPDYAHGSLSTLRVARVKDMVFPLEAHISKELAGCEERIDTALGVGSRDAVGLRAGLGDAEAVVVGRNGDEWATSHDFLDAEITTGWTLVGTVDGKMVIK